MGDNNNNQLGILQGEIRTGELKLTNLEDNLVKHKAELYRLRGELWDLCEHQWKRDYSCAFDDLCKHYCGVCGLWKDRSLYGK